MRRASRPPDTPRCGTCRFFNNDPHVLEREMAGWATLGSAFGAVRGDDGLCRHHDRYLSIRACCNDHTGLT